MRRVMIAFVAIAFLLVAGVFVRQRQPDLPLAAVSTRLAPSAPSLKPIGPTAAAQPSGVALLPSPRPSPTLLPLPATATPAQPPSPTATQPPTAAPIPTPTLQIGHTTELSNVRAGPGTNYPLVIRYAAGQELDIVAVTSARDWYQLRSGAWIFAELVQNAPPVPVAALIPTPPPPTATPRPTPTPGRPTPALPTRMPAVAPEATVAAPAVAAPAVAGTAVPAATPTPVRPMAVVEASILNVRSGPGTAHMIMTTVNEGEKLPAVGRNEDSSWLEVTLPDGRRGWIGAALAGTNLPVDRLAVVTAAPATAAPPPVALPPPAGPGDAAKVLLALMNERRAAARLPALAWSGDLARAAQGQADDCGHRNWGSHAGSDGASLQTRLARAGYSAPWVSENWANARNVQGAFEMWWNESPGNDPHRRNILEPRYKSVGIGVAAGSWGYYFFADFGSR